MRRSLTILGVIMVLSAYGAGTTAAAARGNDPGASSFVSQAKGGNGGGHAGGGGGGGGGKLSTTGNDISWPQCGGTFPSGQAFGIVGLNAGLANNLNPCLASELVWALGSTGHALPSGFPKAALYVNTANAGPDLAKWWPSSGTNIYGTCRLQADTQACAWEYGAAFARQDMEWLTGAASALSAAGVTASGAPRDYTWWLDVETANSWETGTMGLLNNVADLQGMVATFEAAGASVGIYSTTYQWGVITGGSTAPFPDGSASNLVGLPDWIPGARRQSSAESNCSVPGFTGDVLMAQWFGHPYDGDVAC